VIHIADGVDQGAPLFGRPAFENIRRGIRPARPRGFTVVKPTRDLHGKPPTPPLKINEKMTVRFGGHVAINQSIKTAGSAGAAFLAPGIIETPTFPSDCQMIRQRR